MSRSQTRFCAPAAVAVIISLSACSRPPEATGVKRMPAGQEYAGFLSDYSKLKPNANFENTVSFVRDDPAPRQALLDAAPAPALAREPSGPARIETFTVLHDREGVPMRGLVVGRLDDGRRFLAATPDDPDVLAGLEAREAIGLRGRVTTHDGTGCFDPR